MTPEVSVPSSLLTGSTGIPPPFTGKSQKWPEQAKNGGASFFLSPMGGRAQNRVAERKTGIEQNRGAKQGGEKNGKISSFFRKFWKKWI